MEIIFTSLTSADDLCKATNFPDSKILCAKEFSTWVSSKRISFFAIPCFYFSNKNKGKEGRWEEEERQNFHSNDIAVGHNSLWNCCNYKFFAFMLHCGWQKKKKIIIFIFFSLSLQLLCSIGNYKNDFYCSWLKRFTVLLEVIQTEYKWMNEEEKKKKL